MNSPATFSASHAVTLPPLAADGALPLYIHLLPAGDFTGRDGRGPYQLDAAAVLTAFNAAGVALPVDYEHQSIHASENGKPAPAAGWITEIEIRADGVWGKVDWTARAKAFLAAQEYKYLSPVFDYFPVPGKPDSGRVIQLRSAALTNTPNLFLTALNRRGRQSSHSQGVLTVDIPIDVLQSLRYALGLGEAATIEDVQAGLSALVATLKTPETAAFKAEGAAEGATSAEAVITALQKRHSEATAEHARVAARLAELEAEKEAAAIEKAVSAALAAHKITPAGVPEARALCKSSPEGFARFVAALPPAQLTQTASHAAGKPPAASEKNPLIADAESRAAKR